MIPVMVRRSVKPVDQRAEDIVPSVCEPAYLNPPYRRRGEPAGEGIYIDINIIFAVVPLNAIIGFIQDSEAEVSVRAFCHGAELGISSRLSGTR